MSAIATDSLEQGALASTTVRQFQRAVALALLAVGVGCVIYAVEKYVVCPPRRFVENPASVMTRAIGLAHFWIGWLFLLTSPRVRSAGAVGRLLGLVLLGAALCVVCGLSGASHNSFVFLFLYGYFLLHEVRDQTMLYQAYGDAPPASPEGQAFLAVLCRAASLGLTTLLTAGYLLHGFLKGKIAVESPWMQGCLLGALTVLLLASLATGFRALRLGCRLYGDPAGIVTAHRPLLLVYAGICAILLLATVVGSVVFNLIILIHAAAWLLFLRVQLGQRPAPARFGLWSWLRGTPLGFSVLHFGVAALILVLLGLRVYVWERVGLVSEMLDAASFSYWSLMHITIAFWRPR
ncbi:MAG: hypothetical protein JNM56_14495 [Planctomycetia bacterium]|nr:hypothetical protein [Planctomycetia bacterium]